MDEKEKNQKTIIAVVAGLAIGGLLVWVFSSVPSTSTPEETVDEATDTEEMSTEDEMSTDDTATVSRVATGPGLVSAANQPAGSSVTLGEMRYPNERGWIVVREEIAAGLLGNVLGAARYNLVDGLLPTTVELLRNTEAGKTYHVIVYTDNGDNLFDLTDDVPVEEKGGSAIKAVFVAQ